MKGKGGKVMSGQEEGQGKGQFKGVRGDTGNIL